MECSIKKCGVFTKSLLPFLSPWSYNASRAKLYKRPVFDFYLLFILSKKLVCSFFLFYF